MAQAESPGLGKEDEERSEKASSSMCPTTWHQIRVAFPFSPEEFVREAVTKEHPSSVFQGVTEALAKPSKPMPK